MVKPFSYLSYSECIYCYFLKLGLPVTCVVQKVEPKTMSPKFPALVCQHVGVCHFKIKQLKLFHFSVWIFFFVKDK